MQPGDPDGFGVFARLTVSDDGAAVVCHECGVAKKALGTHTWYAHGMTAAQYRLAHGLSSGQSLASPATAQRFHDHALSSPAGLAALAENRDPERARAANTSEGRHSPQLREMRATRRNPRQGRDLTEEEVAGLRSAPDRTVWAQRAWVLRESGASYQGIATATGVSLSAAYVWMKKYRRPPPSSCAPARP